MPVYNYKAINESGRSIRGEISAANEVDLEDRLNQLSLDLVDYQEASERKASIFSRVKMRDKIIFCVQLEQLDRAGVPLLEALSDARDAADSDKMRDILTEVHESVKGGAMLSQAMAQHPKVFNEVFTGLIAAGEKTGNLSASFSHLSHHLKWVDQIRGKVRKALGYPIVLLLVITAVITMLMLFVVPKLVDFMQAQGFELPFHTKALIFVSGIFADYWFVIFSVPVLGAMALFSLYRLSAGFAYRLDLMMLHVPVIGSTMKKIDMARFTHFFGVMYKSGIDILDSLDTAQNVVHNKVLRESIAAARTSVSEGNSLTASLRMSNQFPNLVIRMFKVGEESGNINEAMENINYFYDREVNDAVDTMIGMIQPALTVVLGGVVLWVVAAVFGPLYESFSNMNF